MSPSEPRSFWTPRGLANACRGVLRAGVSGETPITRLSTDTRAIERGDAYLALRGERFDGHDFITQAIERGAAVIIAERDDEAWRAVPLIRVAVTGAALADIASAWRSLLTRTSLIGVTGSNGKTTTVRMIDAVLRSRLRGRASIKSFNNAIGVPLTLLSATLEDEYLVAEAGMNAPGEMEPLSRVLRPDIAVISSIGRAHIGAFADGLTGIAREKNALLTHLRADGFAVATADSPELRAVLKNDPRIVWVGIAGDGDHRVGAIEHTDGGVSFRLGGERFEVNAPGAHNALNAAIAITVARRMGLGDGDIRAGLARFEPAPMRLQRTEVAGLTIVNDAYNANPESVIAALESFGEISAAKRIVVLGEMLEMGGASESVHREIGRRLRAMPSIDLLVTVGPGARCGGEECRGVTHVHEDTLDDPVACARVASMLMEIGGAGGAGVGGAAVLFKGSRGVGLERIIASLRDGAGMIGATPR